MTVFCLYVCITADSTERFCFQGQQRWHATQYRWDADTVLWCVYKNAWRKAFPSFLSHISGCSAGRTLRMVSGLGSAPSSAPRTAGRSSHRCSQALLHPALGTPGQVPAACHAQGLLHFIWRNKMHSLKGEDTFAGICVVSGNTRIWELQTGTKNKDFKLHILVFLCATALRRKPTVTNGQLE